MTDDAGSFTAPMTPQPQTPVAVRLAGQRLYDYALIMRVPRDTPILNVAIPIHQPGLRRDRRLLEWYVRELEDAEP
jgi:hypothetical protein